MYIVKQMVMLYLYKMFVSVQKSWKIIVFNWNVFLTFCC